MYPDTEQFVAAGKAGIDSLNTLAQIQLAALERFSKLNFNAGNAALEGGIRHARAVLAAKDAGDLAGLNAAAAGKRKGVQPVFD